MASAFLSCSDAMANIGRTIGSTMRLFEQPSPTIEGMLQQDKDLENTGIGPTDVGQN